MRVLVTGSSGFIGSHLVARLKEQGHFVRAVDIKATPHRWHLYSKADDLMWTDLRSTGAAAMACATMDHVYHLAADHGGAGYFHGPRDFRAADNNLTIDRNVLNAAINQHVDRLFFAGSACAYPVTFQHRHAKPLKEWMLGKGEGEQLYGNAKFLSLRFMEAAREQQDRQIDARTGVFHTIYGPSQDYLEPRAKFPTALCRKMIEDPKRVEVWGDGTQIRTFLYIEDALQRIQAIMGDKPYLGPVNVGSDEPVTVMQCCEWVAEAAEATPEWVQVDGPTGVESRIPDNGEWNRRYGEEGEITVPTQHGFGETYRWLRQEMAGRLSNAQKQVA